MRTLAEKKPIGKKLRAEVFKRDSFCCQYCGRSAPDVILEVDHLKPIPEGGKNEMRNLITTCRECIRGKENARKDNSQMVIARKAAMDDWNEKRFQMEMMLQWKRESEKLMDEQIDLIETLILDNPEKYRLSDRERKEIKALIRRFGFPLVTEASEIAETQYHREWIRLQKLGGICYNIKIRREKNGN